MYVNLQDERGLDSGKLDEEPTPNKAAHVQKFLIAVDDIHRMVFLHPTKERRYQPAEHGYSLD